MAKKHFNAKELVYIQKYVKTAKRCCLVITLCIMYDQFESTDMQLKNAIYLFKEAMSYYSAPWTTQALKRAKDEFKGVAKTYKGIELNGDLSKVGFQMNVNEMIWNTEATCLFVILKMLRTEFKATYKQLDFFIDKYNEFNEIYGEGKQTPIKTLSDELKDITGIDIFAKGMI